MTCFKRGDRVAVRLDTKLASDDNTPFPYAGRFGVVEKVYADGDINFPVLVSFGKENDVCRFTHNELEHAGELELA